MTKSQVSWITMEISMMLSNSWLIALWTRGLEAVSLLLDYFKCNLKVENGRLPEIEH